ncbi:hypothetical protein SAMN07250955_11017 [Arboricoccus pini]|uniref:Uncharacterized protein n=1 Tax=Arboricoccus pini TaxID=1963835 RepID=A0A212RKB1_9PROT|nr:hypothetical protein SAMN07250955_11017 [Arboricoccus pini]
MLFKADRRRMDRQGQQPQGCSNAHQYRTLCRRPAGAPRDRHTDLTAFMTVPGLEHLSVQTIFSVVIERDRTVSPSAAFRSTSRVALDRQPGSETPDHTPDLSRYLGRSDTQGLETPGS